ncbi:hypothetical protein PMZ80_001267 [Knufia obscura]|uniref:2,2-dialkylglycine decarboxylase n=2 Tax=Knufia TaxID=430999 RepID=A0AAN8I600_9EURO|nr:hypothetical protein PMZ80_001267 [Knufia obscura]KAK5956327.1 hypothetical protein OHC33_002903 [Knufia fluminis]
MILKRHYQEIGADQPISSSELPSGSSSRVQDGEEGGNSPVDGLSCLANYGAEIESPIITHGGGAYIYSESGQRILDWTSGQMSCLLGHSHPEVVEVIKAHAESLIHTSSCMVSPPVIRLAKRLTSVLPPGLDRALFLNTGSESNEAAIRLAKTYTGKFEVVGLGQSWHGMTSGAQGAQYQAGRRGQGPPFPGQHMLPQPNAYHSIFRHKDGTYDWEKELNYGWNLIDQASCGAIAACLVECVQGDGGIHVLPRGYLKALKRHCESRGILLIVDEAQTGLGRTGELFGFEHENVVPDILTLSKPLGNGLPISAMVTSAEIDKVAKEKGFLFFTTHTNDPLVAAVGEKVLEIATRDGLLQNVMARGQQLFAGLRRLKERYGCIGDVRGLGLMAGIEIVSDRDTKEPAKDLAKALSKTMLQRGLWCQLQSQRVFRIGPTLTSTEQEIQDGLDILEEVFSTTAHTQPLCNPGTG